MGEREKIKNQTSQGVKGAHPNFYIFVCAPQVFHFEFRYYVCKYSIFPDHLIKKNYNIHHQAYNNMYGREIKNLF